MATFGWTTTPGADDFSSSTTDKVAVSAAAPAETGIVATANAWLAMDSGASASVRFVIYRDVGGSPTTLLAQSDAITLTGSGRASRTFTFSGANKIQVVAGTTYWIGVTWTDPGSGSIDFYRLSGGSRLEGNGYAPNPFGSTSSLSGPLALWVTYDTAVIIGPVTDSGAGEDTSTVDRTELRSVSEAGAASDVGTVFADWAPAADSGTGADSIVVDQLVDVGLSDEATGDDVIEVADFKGNDLADSGSSDETITLVQTNFVELTDSGAGADTTDLLQARQIVDAGTGVDVITGEGGHDLVDSGEGVDTLTVTVIPFTQVLPLIEGTIYDLVVVARIQRVSGPPTFIEVDPIDWKSLSYSNTLSAPQELTASALISSVPESVLQRLRALHQLATEVWLYRDGQLVFAGPLQGWQTSGEDLTIRCQGLLSYLHGMVVNSDLHFKNIDQAMIVKTLIDQWQALDYGHFGIDTTDVVPTGQTRSESYLRKELHNVGQRVEELGKLAMGFDVEVDPASRRLMIWHPRKGVDRSIGENAIVFDSRNITSGDIVCSVAGGDLASEAYGTSGSAGADDAKFSIAANAELRARYGRTAVTNTWNDVKDQATLDLYTQGLLEARAEVLLVPGPRTRVTPDADLSDYGVGDNIAYDLASQLGINGAFRIRKQTITVSSTGQESVDLEFV